MSPRTFIIYIALVSASVCALTVNSSPSPTPTVPSEPYELLRRQQASQQTLLAAPDATCGYINGQSGSPWGCSSGNCVFATPTATATESQQAAGSVLCCDPKTGCPATPAPTACVDMASMASCTGSCHDDPATLKCTAGINIYCASLSFATPQISAIFCTFMPNRNSTALTAQTTYAGQSQRSFTATVAQLAVSTTSNAPSSATTSSPSVKATSTQAASADPIAAAAQQKSRKKRNTVIGAVVGGVLGALVLIGGAVCLILRKRRNPESTDEAKREDRETVPNAADNEPLGHTVHVAGGKL